MKPIKNLLAFAREAGGAAVLLPVLNQIRPHTHVEVLAKDYALDIFREAGFAPHELKKVSKNTMNGILKNQDRPDVLLSSAASLPHLDMTEKHLWIWARCMGIPSVAVLDQWQNYALRFSGRKADERLSYLPD